MIYKQEGIKAAENQVMTTESHDKTLLTERDKPNTNQRTGTWITTKEVESNVIVARTLAPG